MWMDATREEDHEKTRFYDALLNELEIDRRKALTEAAVIAGRHITTEQSGAFKKVSERNRNFTPMRAFTAEAYLAIRRKFGSEWKAWKSDIRSTLLMPKELRLN